MGGESSIVKCPDIAESHAMRSWYDSTGHAAETKNMSAGGGGAGGARGPNTENRKTFEAAKAEGVPKGGAREVNVYNNVATITYFKHDGTVAYPSCPETKKKLVEINEKSVLASFFGLSWQTCRIQTDRYDAGMFLDRGDTGPFIALHLRAAESYQCFGKQRQPGDRHRNCSIAL